MGFHLVSQFGNGVFGFDGFGDLICFDGLWA